MWWFIDEYINVTGSSGIIDQHQESKQVKGEKVLIPKSKRKTKIPKVKIIPSTPIFVQNMNSCQ